LSRLGIAICTGNLLPISKWNQTAYPFSRDSSVTVQLAKAVAERNQDTTRLKFGQTQTSRSFLFTIFPCLAQATARYGGSAQLSSFACNRNDDKGWVKGLRRHRHNQNSIDLIGSFVHSKTMRINHEQSFLSAKMKL